MTALKCGSTTAVLKGALLTFHTASRSGAEEGKTFNGEESKPTDWTWTCTAN